MSSYILKSNKEKNEILLYQEKSSYSFSPKKGYKEVKKITILDPEMLNTLWEHKLDKEYSKLLKLIYSLVSNDDTTSTDVKKLEKYLKKLYILELELKKVHVMELTEEIGRGR